MRSSAASGVWKDTLITIVDTPGHADFAAEVERGLWAVDGAVLIRFRNGPDGGIQMAADVTDK